MEGEQSARQINRLPNFFECGNNSFERSRLAPARRSDEEIASLI